MFINIITPSKRPQNLLTVSKSINIPKENYRWIVVVDAPKVDLALIPDNALHLCYTNTQSTWGNAQRNRAIDIIKFGWVYFLDDDTLLHPDLWDSVKDLDNDFIHFNQLHKNGRHRIGGTVKLNHIDSGSVLIHHILIGDTRWVLHRRAADGVFIEEVYSRAKTPMFLNKNLSVYNKLR
jgi:hypothetical protein